MGKNRIREQYKSIAVLLRRYDHVDCDYDVFVVIEETVENARYKAAFNARKFFEANEQAVVSWEDWLNAEKTKAIILGYTNKTPGIVYKGFNDFEKQPTPQILKNIRGKEMGDQNE